MLKRFPMNSTSLLPHHFQRDAHQNTRKLQQSDYHGDEKLHMLFLLAYRNQTHLKKEMLMDFCLLLQHVQTILRLCLLPRQDSQANAVCNKSFPFAQGISLNLHFRSSHFSTTFGSNSFRNSVSCSLKVAFVGP